MVVETRAGWDGGRSTDPPGERCGRAKERPTSPSPGGVAMDFLNTT